MAASVPVIATSDLIEVRDSPLHGLGVFATQAIKKGTRIIEYIGERVSHEEADRRYETKDDNDNHTFLFSVDNKVVIDAGVEGNDARYFNHSCDPNCESVIQNRRVFIEAIKDIEPGDEMTYDYQIGRERDDPPNIDEIYACRCGAKDCRGTMLWPPKRPGRAKARAKAAAEEAAAQNGAPAARKKGAQKKGAQKKGAQKKSVSRAKTGGRSSTRSEGSVSARGKPGGKVNARATDFATVRGRAGGKSSTRTASSTSARGGASSKKSAPSKGGAASTRAKGKSAPRAKGGASGSVSRSGSGSRAKSSGRKGARK